VVVSRRDVDGSDCDTKDVGGELEGEGLGWIESERSTGSIWDNDGDFLNVHGDASTGSVSKLPMLDDGASTSLCVDDRCCNDRPWGSDGAATGWLRDISVAMKCPSQIHPPADRQCFRHMRRRHKWATRVT
jgi:hypothetical protein